MVVEAASSPPSTNKPVEADFRREIERVNNNVTEIQEQLKDIQTQLSAIQSGGTANEIEKKAELRAKLQEINDRIQVHENSRLAHQERLGDCQRAVQTYQQQLQLKRSRLTFQSLDKVKERVQQLQGNLYKTNITLPEEKKIIQEISQLKQQIPSIKAALKEVQQLEQNPPNVVEDIQRSQEELDRLKSAIDEERKSKREIQAQLKGLDEAETEKRKERNQIFESLISRRDELTEERDAQTSQLLEAQAKFSGEINAYRDHEAKKKKAQQDKIREKKRLERQELERKELLDKIAGCVVEEDEEEDKQRVPQLFAYCENQIKKLQAEESSPKKKKSKQGIDIAVIGEFGAMGMDLPETIADFEAAMNKLEPLLEGQIAASAKVEEAMAMRRAALIEKLEALDKQIARENKAVDSQSMN